MARKVRDPADVLHNSAHATIAIQEKIEEGNQRRPFATSRHVCRTKIRNHRNTYARRHDRALAGLPGNSELASEKRGSLALVIERLSVAAHEFCFETKATLGRKHCVGVKFCEQEVQPGQVSAR